MTPRTLWIVTPVFYDVESFLALRQAVYRQSRTIRDVLGDMAIRFVVVDDSAGQDADIATATALSDVAVIATLYNLGHQRALVFALRRLATDTRPDDYIVTLDADGEDRPEDLRRLLEALSGGVNALVLARRTKRQESIVFKLLYAVFKAAFRLLTGTVIRSGNYAAFRAQPMGRLIIDPVFDWSYASALVSLPVPLVYVGCERGRRYAGKSKMSAMRLIMHGLRMLMPFVDRIATRVLIAASTVFATALLALTALLAGPFVVGGNVPTWSLVMTGGAVVVALSTAAYAFVLFIVFAQTRAFALRDEIATPRQWKAT